MKREELIASHKITPMVAFISWVIIDPGMEQREAIHG